MEKVSRRIEVGCYAVVRETGIAVKVVKVYSGRGISPNLFATSLGNREFTARELRRITEGQYLAAADRQLFDEQYADYCEFGNVATDRDWEHLMANGIG